MKNHIEFRSTVASTSHYYLQQKHTTDTPFKDILNDYNTPSGLQSTTTPPRTTTPEGTTQPAPQLVGHISKDNPTVSELLVKHHDFGKKGWDIIHSDINSQKPYTKIPDGTPIYYNSVTKELSWPNSPTTQTTPQSALAMDKMIPKTIESTDSSTSNETVPLGTINQKTPTVSHLLASHSKYNHSTWNILASRENKDKNFTALTIGSEVKIHSQTQEITWSFPTSPSKTDSSSSLTHEKSGFAQENLTALTPLPPQEQKSSNQEKLYLGTLDRTHPTVSHLLKGHPEVAGKTWQVLSNPINNQKTFTSITSGTKIYLNISSSEISWTSRSNSTLTTSVASQSINIANTPSTTSPNLTEAVQSFLGKPYEEIDCYSLLVSGLKKMGIPYGGKNGLFNKLTQMAEQKGLPSNAYLNGEGIIEAAGKQLHSQSYMSINNWSKAANDLYQTIQPLLQKGQILSFSTPTRGHTGIISQFDNQWTFINSGNMDNHINHPSSPKEVGEEHLIQEIKNWFKLAKKNDESLIVTLGKLDDAKLLSALKAKEASHTLL